MKAQNQTIFICSLFFLISFVATAQSPPKIMWQETIGSDGIDRLNDIQETNDGHLIVASSSSSSALFEKSVATFSGSMDYWIYKLNIKTGAIIWQQDYGTTLADNIESVDPTNDGGYIACGGSYAGISGNRLIPLQGTSDAYAIKLNSLGVKQWEKSFGGTGSEHGMIRELSSGDLIMAASSNSPASTGNKSAAATYYGGTDIWLVKLNSVGTILWQKSFGGSGSEEAKVMQTSDGGFLLYGKTTSGISGNKFTVGYGMDDGWLIKLNSSGIVQWEKTLGGSFNDDVADVVEIASGGYMVVLNSESGITGNKTSPHYGVFTTGMDDIWAVKLDASGSIIWQKTIGTTDDDDEATIIGTKDCNFLIASSTFPVQNNEKTAPFYGVTDMWLFKMDPDGNIMWQTAYGGNSLDDTPHLLQTSDGNLVLAGQSISNITGVKTDVCRNSWDNWILRLYNSSPWDFGYEDDVPHINEQHIVRNGITEGDDRYWSVVKNSNTDQYWVVGVDKTSGDPKNGTTNSTSYSYAFAQGGIAYDFDAPTIHDFSGDLLVAGHYYDAMIKYRVNKTTGAAISPTIVTNTFIGSQYSPMYPYQALQVGPEQLIIGSILDHNQATPYLRPMVVILDASYNVANIVHHEDNNLQAHMTASRAIPIGGGGEMLIVGGLMDPNGSIKNKIFLLHTDNLGNVISPVQYYEAANPMEDISVDDITIVEANGEYVIGFTYSNSSGGLWPGTIGIDASFAGQWSKYYVPTGIGATSGLAGQIMNNGNNAVFSVSVERATTRLPGTFNIDYTNGNPMPENFIYMNPYYQIRTTNSSLFSSDENVVHVAQHDGTSGFSMIQSNDIGWSKNKCQEQFPVMETDFDLYHSTGNMVERSLSSWSESAHIADDAVVEGDRYSCLAYDASFKKSSDNPQNVVFSEPNMTDGNYKLVWLAAGQYELTAEARIERAHLIDLTGRVVPSDLSIRDTSVLINFESNPQGVYLLQVKTTDGLISTKLVR